MRTSTLHSKDSRVEIVRAEALGLCFGVRDALVALESVRDPAAATIHGELVHNETVRQSLRARGFHEVGEADRAQPITTPDVVVTAHGISDRERRRLERAGHRLIDTTCPLVRRLHVAARRAADAGAHVVIIGRPGRVEVKGLTEDLPSHTVVASVEDVVGLPFDPIVVVAQTTTPPADASAIMARLRVANPGRELTFVDTICDPTKGRLAAVARLAPTVDLMVVVGGANSNNTCRLVAESRRVGARTRQVQGPSDLRAEWFEGVHRVGLTAGTSTPDATVDAVEGEIRSIRYCAAR